MSSVMMFLLAVVYLFGPILIKNGLIPFLLGLAFGYICLIKGAQMFRGVFIATGSIREALFFKF